MGGRQMSRLRKIKPQPSPKTPVVKRPPNCFRILKWSKPNTGALCSLETTAMRACLGQTFTKMMQEVFSLARVFSLCWCCLIPCVAVWAPERSGFSQTQIKFRNWWGKKKSNHKTVPRILIKGYKRKEKKKEQTSFSLISDLAVL